MIGILFLLCNLKDQVLSEDFIKGNGIIQKVERDAIDFTAINIVGNYAINIVCQQNDMGISITGDSNILQYIATEVKDSKLFIFLSKSIYSHNRIEINVKTKELRKLFVSGTNDITLSIFNKDKLDIDMDGAGKMQISGKTDSLTAQLSGTVVVHAEDLKTKIAQISASGTSKAFIYVSEELYGIVKGTAFIYYAGKPKVISRKISGVGTIKESF